MDSLGSDLMGLRSEATDTIAVWVGENAKLLQVLERLPQIATTDKTNL